MQAFKEYLHSLVGGIPYEIYLMALIICVGTVILWRVYGSKRYGRCLSSLLLAEYVFLLYCSTVFIRESRVDRKCDFTPFWSYRAIEQGQIQLLPENIMNVIVFVPIGLLIGVGYANWSWWKVLGLGCLISISIETMQYIFKCGFSEVDDVMHNTLGCAIGFGIAKLMMIIYSAIVGHKKCAKYR